MESKAETFTVEGYNARIRHYLARFKRKSKLLFESKTHDREIIKAINAKIEWRIIYLRLTMPKHKMLSV